MNSLRRLWGRVDHVRYLLRYGHAGPSEGRTAAYHRVLAGGVVDGAVIDGERQTVRKANG